MQLPGLYLFLSGEFLIHVTFLLEILTPEVEGIPLLSKLDVYLLVDKILLRIINMYSAVNWC